MKKSAAWACGGQSVGRAEAMQTQITDRKNRTPYIYPKFNASQQAMVEKFLETQGAINGSAKRPN